MDENKQKLKALKAITAWRQLDGLGLLNNEERNSIKDKLMAMVNMNSIINEIKGLDTYVRAMKKNEDREPEKENLDNLLIHIGYLKAWAGIDIETRTEPVLPIQNVIDSSVIDRDVTYNGKDYKVYNVSLMLAPDDDGAFETIYYQKLRDS